jgi:hypothetical protein
MSHQRRTDTVIRSAQETTLEHTDRVRAYAVSSQPAIHHQWRAKLEVLLVFAIACAACVPFLDHVPFRDELNHILAARALLDHGTLVLIPDAVPMSRAWGFTYLVAGMFWLFGESLVVARLPAVLSGALLVAALFIWVRAEAGRMGAWFAAMLLTFAPIWLQLSQWSRFYTLHALAFFLACLLVYRLFSSPAVSIRKAGALVIGICVALSTALHLQVTTLVGIAGLGLWAMAVSLVWMFRAFPTRTARAMIVAGLAVAGGIGIVVAVLTGFLEQALFFASYADLGAEGSSDRYGFYHDYFLLWYPLPWLLLPVAALIALRTRPKAALLCICIFGIAVLVHSVAASKAARYIFYALPFFFALLGIAVGNARSWYRTWRAAGFPGGGGERRFSPSSRAWVTAAALAAVALYPAGVRPAAVYAYKGVASGDATWAGWGSFHGNPDWSSAGDALAPLVGSADVVLGTYDLAAFYGVGRIDYLMRRMYTPWQGVLAEFEVLERLRTPVVSTEESLATVMACYASGLVFVERHDLRAGRSWTGVAPLVSYLEMHASRLPVADEWEMIVFRWDRVGPQPAEAACEVLPNLTNRR